MGGAKRCAARVCQSIKFPEQLLVPRLTEIRRSVSEKNINLSTTCTFMLHTEHIKCTRLERKSVHKLKTARMRTKRIQAVTLLSSEIALIHFPRLATIDANTAVENGV